jgi:hypothetical protein
MTPSRCAGIAIALCVTLAAAVAAQGPAAPPPPIHPSLATTGGSVTLDTQTGQKIRVTAIATGLVHPWSLAFTDAQTLLVTEQPGRLRIIRDGTLQPSPIWQVSGLPSTRMTAFISSLPIRGSRRITSSTSPTRIRRARYDASQSRAERSMGPR